MNKTQRTILGILLAVVALDLAVTKRLTSLWNHAFHPQNTTTKGTS